MSKLTDDEIDDLIDKWHEGNDSRPLHEAIGMTKDEYKKWIEKGIYE